jgi:hypothetical protein
VQVPFPIGDLQKMWTNNNSESLNHVLKKAIDWKSQPPNFPAQDRGWRAQVCPSVEVTTSLSLAMYSLNRL